MTSTLRNGMYKSGSSGNGSRIHSLFGNRDTSNSSFTIETHVMQQRTPDLARHSSDPKPRLIQQENLAFTTKAEIRHTARNDDLTNKPSRRVPDVQSITAARVDVALQITLDAIRNTRVRHGEKSAIGNEGASRPLHDIERVSKPVSDRRLSQSPIPTLTCSKHAYRPCCHRHESSPCR